MNKTKQLLQKKCLKFNCFNKDHRRYIISKTSAVSQKTDGSHAFYQISNTAEGLVAGLAAESGFVETGLKNNNIFLGKDVKLRETEWFSFYES